MKLLVIGHLVEDRIHLHNEVINRPGGLFYTLTALKNYKRADDQLFVCTNIPSSPDNLFSGLFEGLNTEFVSRSERIPCVDLFIEPGTERKEKYDYIGSSIKLTSVNFSDFDAILINMITGADIKLEDLKYIRNNFYGLIYFDVHTLSRGIGEDLGREFRVIPDFEEWAENIDILQANEIEIKMLGTTQNIELIINQMFDSGVRLIVLTKGKTGARVYYKGDDKEMKSVFLSANKVNVKNTIGCGDVFGAVFFYDYIVKGNILYALKNSTAAAGLTASSGSLKQFSELNRNAIQRSD